MRLLPVLGGQSHTTTTQHRQPHNIHQSYITHYLTHFPLATIANAGRPRGSLRKIYRAFFIIRPLVVVYTIMPGSLGRKVHSLLWPTPGNSNSKCVDESTQTDNLPFQRTYADITRSASSTESPAPRSKRRRLSSSETPVQSNSYPRSSAVFHSPTHRYVGDGLDYRRPAMSADQQRPHPPIIDLTESDDLPVLESRQTSPYSSLISSLSPDPARRAAQQTRPPSHSRDDPEVIELDSDILHEDQHQTNSHGPLPTLNRQESSSDVEFVGARVVNNELLELPALHPHRRLPTPPVMRQGIGLGGFVRRTRDAMLNIGGHIAPAIYRQARLPLNPLPGAVEALRVIGEPPNYDNVAMNYRNPAFHLDARSSDAERGETNRSSTPPEIVDPDPYKEPVPADTGYSRNLKKDDVVVCPSCGKELGQGDDDQEQQIWIAKQCGHVSM